MWRQYEHIPTQEFLCKLAEELIVLIQGLSSECLEVGFSPDDGLDSGVCHSLSVKNGARYLHLTGSSVSSPVNGSTMTLLYRRVVGFSMGQHPINVN